MGNMGRSPLLLFALGVLSSFIPRSRGFSTSQLLSSNVMKYYLFRRANRHKLSNRESQRGAFDGGGLVLHIATDPTIIASHADEDGGRSYDFVSVEEAEEALQKERARYEGERSKLEWLLEVQHQQLQDLANGRREKAKVGGKNDGNRGRNSSGATKSSSRIVILGAHGHVDANMKSSGKKNRQKGNRTSFRKNSKRKDRDNSNDNDYTYSEMQELEYFLQDAVVENEKLRRRLHEQRHQYNIERAIFEDELREGRDQLNCVRDELHMERAYFETSRRMLQQLLQEEQQKVQELEKELRMIMISRGEVLSHQEQSQDDYQERRRQEHAQKQYIQQEQYRDPMHDTNNYHQQKRRSSNKAGFTMNINDVQCPLYP